MDKSDWSLTRSFLAVAETGSLSAAARRLGLSQPTLSRHITDLESRLGPLFHRQPRGLAPNGTALALIPHAKAMEEAAARLSLAAAGRQEAPTGTVRLTASRIVSTYILPAILADLRLCEPGIEIELVPSDTTENLLTREADIALRMYRPTQLDVISAHVADLPFGIYAARSYIARRGMPRVLDDLLSHDLVGFDRSDLIVRLMKSLGVLRRLEDFPVRCDDQIVHWALVRAGMGIGGMQHLVAGQDPEMIALFVDLPLPPLPVWLSAHQALRHTPRIRRVFDHLSQAFRALKS
jgi:DNA-binding transcriptional LysR family regulator